MALSLESSGREVFKKKKSNTDNIIHLWVPNDGDLRDLIMQRKIQNLYRKKRPIEFWLIFIMLTCDVITLGR